MKRLHLLTIAALFLGSLLQVGCGPTGPQTLPVSGSVTFDGAPVKEGDVLFVPEESALAPEGGKIVDGKFQMRSKPGRCRVQISALDIGPDTKWEMGSPIAKNFIPRWYNDETTLTAEVTSGGENHFDFALSSKRPQ